MRYAGSFARSCATSRGTAGLERPVSRPGGGVSAITIVEQDGKAAAPGGQRMGRRSKTRATTSAHSAPCENGRLRRACANTWRNAGA